jgi:hypothetical protein
MSRRGMKKGSRCVRKHRNGRCAKFSSSGSKKRRGGKPSKRKPKEKSFLQQMEERYKSTPARLYASPSYAKKEEEEPSRNRGKFVWAGDKWSALSGLFSRRKRR